MADMIVKGATIVDGSGAPSYRGDIYITGEKIEAVIVPEVPAEKRPPEPSVVVDARDRIVTPGFVDAHGHSDFNVLANPNCESKLRQGITTEIIGNCGSSAFPLLGAMLDEEREDNKSIGLDVNWSTMSEYADRLAQAKPAINLATFVGHSSIRGSVLGFEDRPPSTGELSTMMRHVEEAMEGGALGLSTGLIYAPGMFADRQELVECQKAAAKRGGMYSSHVRGEGDTLIEAADEFLAVCEGANCQGQFAHLKASGPRNWGKVARVIGMIEDTNAGGRRVRFDKYPYIASSTSLGSLLPRWARAGGRDAILERLDDPALRDRIVAEAKADNEGKDGWDSVLISFAACSEFARFQGQTIGQIARELGVDADEVFVQMLRLSRVGTSICVYSMNQDETDQAILHPLGMVCTDSGARAPYGALAHDLPHPRAYGTFGKYFRDYVKERPLLKLEEAVAKVTSLPCETFGLRDRGLIRPGCHADLLVIDWPDYADCARFADPHHYCSGIDAIIVNGTLTIAGGQHTGKRGGRLLRRNAV